MLFSTILIVQKDKIALGDLNVKLSIKLMFNIYKPNILFLKGVLNGKKQKK